MKAVVRNALIVGGGFSGMSAAIELRKLGVAVDLVEMDPSWRNYGAGISIGGPTLRAFATLGILERFLEEGYACDGTDIHAADGRLLAQIQTPRVAGNGVPGNGAVMRPALAKMLADATLAAGAEVRLGCTVRTFRQKADRVDVEFSDASSRSYDLVIGADGLFSKTRQMLLPDAPAPRYSGQCVWRAVLPRHPEIERTTLWIATTLKAGLNPVSPGRMYLFVNEVRATREAVQAEGLLAQLKALLSQFPARVPGEVREQLDEQSLVVFRPLDNLLVPAPWFRGRVVLIGDAVHATTPHLAAGAGIGIEDAIVLAQEISRGASANAALEAFQVRRWERCRMVVENSARLGQIEIDGGDKAEHTRIMQESFAALARPL